MILMYRTEGQTSHMKPRRQSCKHLTLSKNTDRDLMWTRREKGCMVLTFLLQIPMMFITRDMKCSFLEDFHHCCHGVLVFRRVSFTPQKSAKVPSRNGRVLPLLLTLQRGGQHDPFCTVDPTTEHMRLRHVVLW